MQRRILIVLLAAALAVLSGVAVLVYASGADERAVEGAKGVKVLLAVDVIPADTTGAQIKSRKLVRQVTMPARSVPSGALTSMDGSLDNLVLSSTLQRDQMLLRGQFNKTIPTPSASPTFVIPKDRVAVSVDAGMAPQVAGNVEAGAKVIVYCSWRPDGTKWETDVMAPEATVISVGEAPLAAATASPAASPAPSASAATGLQRYVVTLAVTEREGQGVSLCYNAGKLHLGLLAMPSPSATEPDS